MSLSQSKGKAGVHNDLESALEDKRTERNKGRVSEKENMKWTETEPQDKVSPVISNTEQTFSLVFGSFERYAVVYFTYI